MKIDCESLPCPCSTGAGVPAPPEPTPIPTPTPEPTPQPTPEPSPTPPELTLEGANPAGCTRPKTVQRITFSKTKYRNIRRHYIAAVGRGWPRILVVNRPFAAARRQRLLEGFATRAGYDRDEYPPAVGRGRGHGLVRGVTPKGWLADVAYVGSSENRSHGARLGIKLRRFCNGTRFRYIFY